MSGDEKRDAMTGKLEEEIPELAAARRDRYPQWARRERGVSVRATWRSRGEALLPAAGKLRCEAIQIGCESVELDNFIDAALQARGFQAVDTAVELQVFRDGSDRSRG